MIEVHLQPKVCRLVPIDINYLYYLNFTLYEIALTSYHYHYSKIGKQPVENINEKTEPKLGASKPLPRYARLFEIICENL